MALLATYKHTKTKDVFKNIIVRIGTYRNTSINKATRLEQLREGKLMVEWIVTVFYPETAEDEIVVQGLLKIAEKMTFAIMQPEKLFDFSDELGFLRVINNIVSG